MVKKMLLHQNAPSTLIRIRKKLLYFDSNRNLYRGAKHPRSIQLGCNHEQSCVNNGSILTQIHASETKKTLSSNTIKLKIVGY